MIAGTEPRTISVRFNKACTNALIRDVIDCFQHDYDVIDMQFAKGVRLKISCLAYHMVKGALSDNG